MEKALNAYTKELAAARRKHHIIFGAAAAAALLVGALTFWQLRAPGVALTEETLEEEYIAIEAEPVPLAEEAPAAVEEAAPAAAEEAPAEPAVTEETPAGAETETAEAAEPAEITESVEAAGIDGNDNAETPAGTETAETEETPAAETEETEETEETGELEEAAEAEDGPESDPDADVESAAYWESTLPGELPEDWGEAVAAVAVSQLDYTESERNFVLADDGERKGYTRYGAWYGLPYGDWCAMFASFCLNYAEIPEAAVPYAAGTHAWEVQLKNLNLWHDADEYTPNPGDLVFFDWDGETGTARHVGIVEFLDENGDLHTIEGNTADMVARREYAADSSDVFGYGDIAAAYENYQALLAENGGETAGTEADEDQVFTQTAAAGDFTVTVEYTAAARFPEEAELRVSQYDRDSAEFQARCEEAGYDLDWLLNIGFYVDDEEIEPAAEVTVTINHNNGEALGDTVTHFTEDGMELLGGSEGETLSFVTTSFSDYSFARRVARAIVGGGDVTTADLTDGTQYIIYAVVETTTGTGPNRTTNKSYYVLDKDGLTVDGSLIDGVISVEEGDVLWTYDANNQSLQNTVSQKYLEITTTSSGNWPFSSTTYTLSTKAEETNSNTKVVYKLASTYSKNGLQIGSGYLTYDNSKFDASGSRSVAIYLQPVTASTGGETGGETEEPDTPALSIKEPDYNKTVTKVDETSDVYDLTLDVAAELKNQTKPYKYQILFILDTSGSMKDSLSSATTAITDLIKDINTNKQNDIKATYSLITFSDTATSATQWADTLSISANANGGTNYQAALYQASQVEWDPSANKVVIFLTDGLPQRITYTTGSSEDYDFYKTNGGSKTYYKLSNGGTAFSIETDWSNNTGPEGQGQNSYTLNSTKYSSKWDLPYAGAVMAARELQCDYFYGIGIGSEMTSTTVSGNVSLPSTPSGITTPLALLQSVANHVNARYVKQGEVLSDNVTLESYFSDVIADTMTVACNDVSISDTLSEYAEFVNGEVTVSVTDNKGNAVTVTPDSGDPTKFSFTSDGETITVTAKIDTAAKTVTLVFPETYRLKDGWRYSVTTRIQPADKAYQEYPNYNATGDAETGTHQNEAGFYSNDNANATLDYTVINTSDNSKTPNKVNYPKPVIQVHPATVTVTKVFEGLEESQIPGRTVNTETGDASVENLISFKKNDVSGGSMTLGNERHNEETGTYSYEKVFYLRPGTVFEAEESTTAADVEGYENIVAVAVSGVTGATTTANKVTLPAAGYGGEYTVTFTNTYTARAKVRIFKKSDDGGALGGAEFTLTDANGDPAFKDANGDAVPLVSGSGEEGKDDKGYITLPGTLPAGTYTLTETKAPDGYNRLAEPITITVGTGASGPVITVDQGSGIETLEKDTDPVTEKELNSYTIEVTNHSGRELPSTGGSGIGKFIALGLGLMGVAGAGMVIGRKRRNRG